MTTRLIHIVLAMSPFALGAQQPPSPKSIPVVNLPSASATSVQTVGAVIGIRELPGGDLLVDDGVRRQLRLFDATLATSSIVLDSAAGLANSYGTSATPLVPYLGDSTLFADQKSRTILVIDSRGRVARTMAPPNEDGLGAVNGSSSSTDNRGRLVYLGQRRGRPFATPNGVAFPDSLPVLRADLDLHRVDTLGLVSRPLAKGTAPTRGANGVTYTMFAIDPLKTIDEWSVLSGGSVALVRGHDYHVDWVLADGTRKSSGKMPFDWKKLTDDDKRKLADSARVAQNALIASDRFESEVTMMTKGDFNGVPGAGGGDAGEKGGRGGGRGGGGGGAGGGGGGGSGLSEHGRGYMVREAEVIPLDQIADYYPPIRPGATKADLDDHLWILPTTSAQSLHGELIYDVVNAGGDLFRRVRLPAGRSVVGFGRGGIVYMISGDKANGFHVERTRLP